MSNFIFIHIYDENYPIINKNKYLLIILYYNNNFNIFS